MSAVLELRPESRPRKSPRRVWERRRFVTRVVRPGHMKRSLSHSLTYSRELPQTSPSGANASDLADQRSVPPHWLSGRPTVCWALPKILLCKTYCIVVQRIPMGNSSLAVQLSTTQLDQFVRVACAGGVQRTAICGCRGERAAPAVGSDSMFRHRVSACCWLVQR